MAENKNNKKGSAIFERFLSMIDNVQEDNYENNVTSETGSEDTPLSENVKEFFGSEVSEEPEVTEETRKISSEELSSLLDICGLDIQPDESENTMVFKTSDEESDGGNDEHNDEVEETHVFTKLGNEAEEDSDAEDDGEEYEARDFRPIRRSRRYRSF